MENPHNQDLCLDTSKWIGDVNYKYTIFEDEIDNKGLQDPSRKTKIKVLIYKVLIYYKKEIADLEKARRQEKIDKAKEYLKDNPGISKLSGSREVNKYIKGVSSVSETGEVADKITYLLDENKIKEDEKLDGFFCLITSELDYDEEKIKSSYSQLWMIEESFRITKSDLDNRPFFVSKEEHIEGRMLETFVALLIIRLMQYKMKDKKISVQRIIEALNSCNCTMVSKDVVHVERIGGRNAFFYKQYNDGKEKNQH